MANLVKVLSIDGGGIRGIIPAMVLDEMEKRTGKRICQLFDLIAGTSTGGILALGLTKQAPNRSGLPEYWAKDLVDLYENEGRDVFPRSIEDLLPFDNIFEERYPSDGIETLLEKYCGDARLKDSLTPVMITSYETERRLPFFFRSERAKNDPSYDFPIRQVARATSAAPTYFEPLRIDIEGSSDYYSLIDGGVFANNPAMCAYAEVRSGNLRDVHSKSDILLVSLGTGELTRRLAHNEIKGWGLANWAQPILNVVFDGVNDTVEYQLQQLLPRKRKEPRYYRFQVRLNEENENMDDAGPENIRALKLLAEDLIRNSRESLDILSEQLTRK